MNLSFRFLSGVLLTVTGILLAMHFAFASVQHLMTDVMILRYALASLFFMAACILSLCWFYYRSGNQPREMVWVTGVLILLTMIAILTGAGEMRGGLQFGNQLTGVHLRRIGQLTGVQVLFVLTCCYEGLE